MRSYCSSDNFFLFLKTDFCATLGGKNTSKIVRTILAELISPELAMKLNYTGTGTAGKQGFRYLDLRVIVLGKPVLSINLVYFSLNRIHLIAY